MKYLIKKELIDLFKTASNLKTSVNKKYKLLKNKSVQVIANDKNFWSVLNFETYWILLYSEKNEIEKIWKSSNYNELLDEVYPFLNKKWLLLKEKSISIVSEIIENETKENNQFSFDETFNQKNLNNDEDLKQIQEKDIKNFLNDWNFVKIEINWKSMSLIKTYWKVNTLIYNRNSIIQILIEYIESLIKDKKENKIENINKEISIMFSDQSVQKLSILEWDDWESIQTKEKDNSYIDKNLVNSVFVLCSLNDLVINRTQLKIWLNKIIKRNEFRIIYF